MARPRRAAVARLGALRDPPPGAAHHALQVRTTLAAALPLEASSFVCSSRARARAISLRVPRPRSRARGRPRENEPGGSLDRRLFHRDATRRRDRRDPARVHRARPPHGAIRSRSDDRPFRSVLDSQATSQLRPARADGRGEQGEPAVSISRRARGGRRGALRRALGWA